MNMNLSCSVYYTDTLCREVKDDSKDLREVKDDSKDFRDNSKDSVDVEDNSNDFRQVKDNSKDFVTSPCTLGMTPRT